MEYKLSSSFKFNDQISRADKHYAIMRINEFRASCPYDSRFSGEFKKNGTAITGKIKILFSRGEFEAEHKASSMEIVMKEIKKQVTRQIEEWRDNRFTDDSTYAEYQKKVK